MNEDKYIRSRRKRSLEYFIPELNKWVGHRLLKKTIFSIGMTEESWYNKHFLQKDSSGKPIIPTCEYSKCKKILPFIGISKGGYRKSCGISCHNKHIAEDESSYCHSDENKRKRSIRMTKLYKDKSSYLNTESFRKHLSSFGMYSNSEESKRKKSESIKSKWQDLNSKYNTKEFRESLLDRFGKNSIRYSYYSSKMNTIFKLRSSYEMYYAEILDNYDEVEEFYYEPLTINYTVDGKFHRYTPDFKIITNEGYSIYVEVKPKCFIEDDIVKVKMESLRNEIRKFDEVSDAIFVTEDMIFNSDILKSITHL